VIRAILVCAAALVAAAFLAAAGRSAPSTCLRAEIAEWSIVPSAGVVPAGRVCISARNLGEEMHQLLVVRTPRFGATLRLRGDRAVASPVAAPISIGPGQTRSFIVRLRPGSYVLLDNLSWSYWKGTSVSISVR
jgi:hypothetical protein